MKQQKLNSYKKQSGFTLIELVVVIAILGILAATAIPRFTDMTNSARVAAVNGMYGAVQSAATIAHAQALASGQNGATGSITMEGTTVDLVNGYPSTATGILAAMATTSGFDTSTAGTFSLKDSSGTAIAACNVVYAQPAALNGSPTITVTTTC